MTKFSCREKINILNQGLKNIKTKTKKRVQSQGTHAINERIGVKICANM